MKIVNATILKYFLYLLRILILLPRNRGILYKQFPQNGRSADNAVAEQMERMVDLLKREIEYPAPQDSFSMASGTAAATGMDGTTFLWSERLTRYCI